MKKEIIYTDQAPSPAGKYSQAVKLGNLVFLAGTVPFDLKTGAMLEPGNMGAQTKIVLQYMQQILLKAGSSLDHVVKVTAFIDDLDRFKEYDQAYSEFFNGEPPARSTIQVAKFLPGMCVEIECIAYVPE